MQTRNEIRNVESLGPKSVQRIRPFAPLTLQERLRFFFAQSSIRIACGLVLAAVIVGFIYGSNTQASPGVARSTPTTAPIPISTTQKIATIRVYVAGAVNTPGVIELKTTDRIVDAISKAGGVNSNADLNYCNLAQFVADGQTIHIPIKGQTQNSSCGNNQISGASNNSTQAGNGSPASQGKINLNTASQSEIETLPGIGPTMGAAIISYRTQHGSFSSINDLRKVKGIGDKRFADLKDLVSV